MDIFVTIRFLDSSCIFDNTIPIYRSEITDVDELKTRLMDEWAQVHPSIVDAAITQWRRRLSASPCKRGTLRT